MKLLSFIPCRPGRVASTSGSTTESTSSSARTTRARTVPTRRRVTVQAGVSFTDVSDPSQAQASSGSLLTEPERKDAWLRHRRSLCRMSCATMSQSKKNPGKGFFANHELVIIDYNDPTHPVQVGSFHIQGQHIGETYGPTDAGVNSGRDAAADLVPRGLLRQGQALHRLSRCGHGGPGRRRTVRIRSRSPASTTCHHTAARTSAWRTARFRCCRDRTSVPKLVINTDELFGCPPGFGRVIDISDLSNPQIMSTFRIPHVSDGYDFTAEQFVCPPGGSLTSHLPVAELPLGEPVLRDLVQRRRARDRFLEPV